MSEELDLSIDNYISDEFSICREERQYALYLSNVLRYYGKNPKNPNKKDADDNSKPCNRIDNEKIKNIFLACGFNKKGLENIVIENVFYEATFMRDFFERNRRIHLSYPLSPKEVCKQKTFKRSSYKISNEGGSFNRNLLEFCWDSIKNPKTEKEKIDFNDNDDIEELNYGRNEIPVKYSSIKNLTRAMMNSKPDLAVIYRDSERDQRKKLLFLECKFDSGEDKVSGDEGTDGYTQTAIQGYIAEFLCKYYLKDKGIVISNIMKKNNGKCQSRKVQFSRKKQIKPQNDGNESGNIGISSLIELEREIFNVKIMNS